MSQEYFMQNLVAQVLEQAREGVQRLYVNVFLLLDLIFYSNYAYIC